MNQNQVIGIIVAILLIIVFLKPSGLNVVYGTGCNFITSVDSESGYVANDYISVDNLNNDGILEAYGFKENIVSTNNIINFRTTSLNYIDTSSIAYSGTCGNPLVGYESPYTIWSGTGTCPNSVNLQLTISNLPGFVSRSGTTNLYYHLGDSTILRVCTDHLDGTISYMDYDSSWYTDPGSTDNRVSLSTTSNNPTYENICGADISATLQSFLVTTPAGKTVYKCDDIYTCLMNNALSGYKFDAALAPTGAKTNCIACGNNLVETGESCDGTDKGAETCVSKGYDSGIIGCTSTCTYDTTPCITNPLCGNSIINSGEQCDTSNLNGKTCSTEGFNDGALGCTSTCSFNTINCFNRPILTGFNGLTTAITSNYDNVPNLILDTSLGSISFTQSIDSRNINLNAATTIYSTKVTITESKLNKPAIIKLLNINYQIPKILKDGVVCATCVVTNTNPFTFTVPGFSTYEVVEGNTTTNGGTTGGTTSGGGGGGGGTPSTGTTITLKTCYIKSNDNPVQCSTEQTTSCTGTYFTTENDCINAYAPPTTTNNIYIYIALIIAGIIIYITVKNER